MPEAWYEVGLIRVRAWVPVEEGKGGEIDPAEGGRHVRIQ
jgi:hypothetical protein